jgi:putative spermidine/putrescine transport system substrate-binding protein
LQWATIPRIGRIVLVAAAACLGADAAAIAAEEIRVSGSGGQSGESVKEGYIKPFTEKTGNKVVFENIAGSPLGVLQAMVESRNITSVLVEMGGPAVAQAKAMGLIEPLDWNAIAPAPLFEEAKDPSALGYQYYSVVMAWRKDAKPLTSWADFWNVNDFPGKRALPDIPYYALPFALLADGVPPEKLYPIDLDRAFASLNKIKDHVSVWWTSGAQPPQLLKDNEVQYAAPYSGRVAGNPDIGFTFNQGQLAISYFVVPKGADPAKKAVAMKLLHEFTLAENQAKAATIISYTGGNPELDKLLPKDKLQDFPTYKPNRDKQLLPNTAYWFEKTDEVQRRWQEFKLGL